VLELIEKLCTRVIVLHRGKVVADDDVQRLRALQAAGSLEEVFGQLVLREDPERTASNIAEVIAIRA
jgi:ABC-2 type transport system ATP-binding protein